MNKVVARPVLKTVGPNGQISLGKHLAGRQVQVEEYEDGSIRILPGVFVPDNERWLLRSDVGADLDSALAALANHEPEDMPRVALQKAIGDEADNS